MIEVLNDFDCSDDGNGVDDESEADEDTMKNMMMIVTMMAISNNVMMV